MFVVFCTAKIVYICVIMTCSPSYCLCDTDPWNVCMYRGADKSLAQPGRKQATATEDFDFHISYS